MLRSGKKYLLSLCTNYKEDQINMKTLYFFGLSSLVLLFLLEEREAKVFTKCGLTKELLNNGFDRTLVGNWVCLIESESQKNTSKVVNKANGGQGLGLFQINSKEWCTFGRKGGKCNIRCEELIDENIVNDGVCAKQIQAQLGFRTWEGWVRSCKNRDLSNYVKVCV